MRHQQEVGGFSPLPYPATSTGERARQEGLRSIPSADPTHPSRVEDLRRVPAMHGATGCRPRILLLGLTLGTGNPCGVQLHFARVAGFLPATSPETSGRQPVAPCISPTNP